MSLQLIESTILRTTIIALPEMQALVELEDTPGQYKVFWEDVDEGIELPFIVISQLAGGWEHKTPNRASESIWKIVGTTANKATAVLFAEAFGLLDRLAPDTSDFPDVYAYHWLEETLPIYERYTLENVPIIRVGGFFRICLSHS